MKRILVLALIAALGASGADAQSCKDAMGKVTKCQPAAPTAKPADVKSDMAAAKTSAAMDTRADGMPSVAHAPVCKVGKPCGKTCVSKNTVCRKPA